MSVYLCIALMIASPANSDTYDGGFIIFLGSLVIGKRYSFLLKLNPAV